MYAFVDKHLDLCLRGLFARPSVVFYASEAIEQDSLHNGIEDAVLGITD